ncbi:MAG TPA: PH domain-containing protein [Anaerolineae bacterium]|nr:PH domain-containing protein [Anaerolineae bacterium]
MNSGHGGNSTAAEQGEVVRFFPGQRVSETILLEGHPVFTPPLIAMGSCLALIVLSIVAMFGFSSLHPLALLIGSAWVLCLFLLAAQSVSELIRRFNTKFTLTQKNVYVASGVMQRRNKTLIIGRIQDVVVEQGPLGIIFNYGNVRVETAGERGGLVLHDAPNPLSWRATILTAAAFALRSRANAE